ncbi:MAG: hypothetical protein AB7L09_22200 [Nitrospira sp.]
MANGQVRFGNSTDHQFNQALNMLAQSRSLSVSGLTSAQAGLFAYSAGRLYVLNSGGTAFELIATDSDLLGGQNSAFHRDRANHTGTQVASTISDFDTQVRTSRLDQMAAPTAAVSLNSQKITSLADGTAGSDAATYGQLLALINNRGFKDPVRVATTANVASLAGGAPNTLDGITLAANDRILVKDQTTGAENGIYTVTTLGTGANGTWTRATDADSSAELPPGSVLSVQEGTANGDKMFMLATNGPITLGTTALTFSAYGASSGEIGVAGAGLTKTGSTYDVGAGTGISVGASTVSIDTSVVARVVRGTVPSGGSASITINHGLGLGANQNIAKLTLIERSSGDAVEFGWTRVDGNNVSTVLPAAPSANQWDWTVIG